MTSNPYTSERWWVASLGKTLIWARQRIHDTGTCEVFDCDGRLTTYDSEDSANAALLDAEFRAYDGLDEDDAIALGFSLEAVSPPKASTDTALRELMVQSIRPKH